ncbi:hypothetical protein NF27_CG00610 [Candidatus Jidaibacter acanthamoeba]|uniref:Uncharacterized protein n=1 Tax=Candidatus Jidaibacter acanthamoebae TaxID=86105 RepID=A0A0C1N0P2_9RICK|nr:hypothetical protein [Candidatus Jidaibacter acanthamoeba]KIE05881.1 hypothetical protein NF27_CG00610 [Candidatus Jidaibacter acanthamoeba]
MNNKISSIHFCDKIYFERDTTLFLRDQSVSLFGSKSTTIVRMLQGIWPGSISTPDKISISGVLSSNIRLLTDAERLGDLFALSLIHRIISITASSAKLYTDNSNIRPLFKYTTSLALSAIPALFLIYVVGYPAEDLILNACITQLSAAAISFVSLRASNFLRSLELISYDNEFSKTGYISRLLTSSAIDIFLSACLHGMQYYMNPVNQFGFHNTIVYCFKNHSSYSIHSASNLEIRQLIYSTIPLISIVDKAVWFLGKTAVDTCILGLNAFGYIPDIRSPFINAFANTNKEILEVGNKPIREPWTKKQRFEYKRMQEENKTAEQEITDLRKNIATIDYAKPDKEPDDRLRHRVKEKVKTRPSTSRVPGSIDKKEQLPQMEQEQDFTTPYKITTEIYTFYKIDSGLLKNTWGVLELKKYKGDENLFERSLASGHVSNKNSSIKYIKSSDKYEIRPRSTGDRILGKLEKGKAGFNGLASLGEAMDLYEKCKAACNGEEPSLIIFNQRVKHQDIGRA